MAKEDEVYVDVAGSAKSLNQSLKALGDTAKKTSGDIESLDTKMSSLKSKFDNMSSGLKGMQLKIDTSEAVSNLQKVQDKLEKSKKSISLFRGSVDIKSGMDIGDRFEIDNSGFEKLNTTLDSIYDKIGKFKSSFSGVGKILNSILTIFSKIGNFIKSATSNVIKFAGKIKSSLGHLGKMGKETMQINDSWKKGLKRVLQYASALFGIRTYYTVMRSAALAWLNSSNEAAQQLSANLDYMKYAMGSALAPIIVYITNLIYNLLKAIQRVFYFFTGINIFAKATASNMKKTAGSAKEAAKQLAGFDELNNLTFDKAGGGGGGDIAPNIDLSSIESFWDRFDGDWYQLGVNIGEGIAEALASIPWDKIQAAASAAGLHLAELLNGMLDTGMFYMLGYTLAQGFNTALYFLDSFIQEFHWDKLGKQLAIGLMGITNNIDWDTLARVISGGFNGVFETIYNFFISYPWGDLGSKVSKLIYDTFTQIDAVMIGNAIGSGINAAIDFAKNAITIENFKLFGEKLGTTFKTLIEKIKWKELGETVGNLFKGIFEGISSFLESVNWEEVGNKIKEFLEGLDWPGIWEDLKNTIADVFGSFDEILTGIFGEDKATKIEAIAGAILVIVGAIKALTIIMGIAVPIITLINGVMTAFGVSVGVATAAVLLIPIAIALLVAAIVAAVILIVKHWDDIKAAAIALKDKVVEKMTELKEKVIELWEKIKTTVKEKVENLKKSVIEKWENLKKTVKDKVEEIKKNAVDKFENMKNMVTDKVSSLKTSVIEKFDNIKNGIKEKIEWARDKVKDAIDKIKGFFKFEWSLPQIKLPHFGIDWDANGAIGQAFQKIGLPGLPKLKVDFYKNGGFPDEGDLFIANEAGPEWVSTMRGKTAVANQDQMTTGIEQAAYSGMYKAIQDAGFGNTVNKIYLGTKDISKAIKKQERSNANMYGIVGG